MKQYTLCFLVKRDLHDAVIEVCLAMKKRGLGEGRWNGSGGKFDPKLDQDIVAAAKRELREELEVEAQELIPVAKLIFNDKYDPDPQTGEVFLVEQWTGEPSETEEMAPQWFKVSDIPYDQMWQDDKLWLPQVLAGKKVRGEFWFDAADKLLDSRVSEWTN